MEVVIKSNTPFKREIHEWNHMDEKTGALLRGRAEANRYADGKINSYGKSLSQSLETTDGIHHKQHKQMNILQAITSSGSSLEVVRAHTSTSSYSSKRLSQNAKSDFLYNPRVENEETGSTKQLCVTEISDGTNDLYSTHNRTGTTSINIPTCNNNDFHIFKSHHTDNQVETITNKKRSFDVGSRQSQINEMLFGKETNKERFLRGKSASIEELANIDDEAVKSYEWKRVSKTRRSLQFPEAKKVNYHYRTSRPADLPENSVNVLKLKQNIENGMQNSAKEQNKCENNGFVALDSILNLKETSIRLDGAGFRSSDEILTAESLQDIRRRLRKLSNPESLQSDTSSTINAEAAHVEQNWKSLEIRKNRECDDDDWLSRRKSYGFEKMQPTSASLSGKVESSVDSGLGLSRSSDLPSNWSPPTSSNELQQQRTIITFGNHKSKPVPMRRKSTANRNSDDDLKRHSIAIDEKIGEHYREKELDKKISLVNLNGQFEEKLAIDGRTKKVEFSKTEIHFAADSGKVNIVETNAKPPPTNSFRRRRRLETGSEPNGHQITVTEEDDVLQPSPENVGVKVTTSIGSVASLVGNERTKNDLEECHSEDGHLRGILKNKPIKPKPYHLGMEDYKSLWGVKLKSVDNEHTSWRNSRDFDESDHSKVHLNCIENQHESSSSQQKSSSPFTTTTLKDETMQRPSANEGFHKISIDLKLPHPKSMDKIMNELKSTSLIIKTMKSSSFFDDAMKHLEQESPLIRSSSLRLPNESLPKSSSSNSIHLQLPHRYSSSLDGDCSVLDGFLEENQKFQKSIAKQREIFEEQRQQVPVAAPRFKKILSPHQQLNQQLSQLKSLYKNLNDSDDENVKADEEVKNFLSQTEEENSSEISGSWSKARVKKIANAFQQQSLTKGAKWMTPKHVSSNWIKDSSVEAAPRTSLAKYDSSSNENERIYSNVQDNSVRVNIKNFESSSTLSRSNSLRMKKDEAVEQKLITGTRQLKAHELTFFGIKSAPITKAHSFESKAFQLHSTSDTNEKTSTNSITLKPITHSSNYHQKPDLILHHEHKYPSKSSTPELSYDKKCLIAPLDACIEEAKNLEPLYENLIREKSKSNNYNRLSDIKRDEKILFELSRAADEIMETCKEMYQQDNEEKQRKAHMTGLTKNSLETISEVEKNGHKPKAMMKSKGVQVMRNFEDSLRRYHRVPQQRTSSQSSVESFTQTKVSSASTSTALARHRTRGNELSKNKGIGSKTSSINSRTRECDYGSDNSTRHRLKNRQLSEKKSNASSSESDLPNSSVEEPPRRPKRVKHRSEEKSRDIKKSSRTVIDLKNNLAQSSPKNNDSKLRSSVKKSSSSSAYPDTTLSSPSNNAYVSTTEHKSETLMIPPKRRNYRRSKKIVRRNSSLKSKNSKTFKYCTNQQLTRRIQLDNCICS